jgi:isopentenyldiphosphate isomerase
MSSQHINIVNDKNELLGTKPRNELNNETDRYQYSALWITNNKGETLLAQRKLTKDKDPGLWGPAVAGTVDAGETFEINIYKEAEEEIGLTNTEFIKGPLIRMDSPRRNFGQWYSAEVNREANTFTLQEREVEQLAWVSIVKLIADIEAHPEKYVPALPLAIKELTIANGVEVNRIYTHYNGGRYLLLSIADESTNIRTGKKVAVYVSLKYGVLKTRDLTEFLEPVVWPDGETRTRFVLEEELKN